jgi:hypothetical protein
MGGTIITKSNGIVCKNPGHGIELSKSGYTYGRMEVINNHSETNPEIMKSPWYANLFMIVPIPCSRIPK